MALIRDVLLSEFDNEMALTRRLLERLPEPTFAWKPHEKSMSLCALATHLAQIPHWGTSILRRDSYDLILDHTDAPAEQQNVADVLAVFDVHTAEVRKALVEQTDAQLAAPWAFRRGGHLIMSLPRLGALRRFFLNHLVHHRGQLTVYLRLLNVPLPPMYGPTADETM